MKSCQYCEKEVQESAKFCNHCGKNLVDEPAVKQTESEEIDTPAVEQEPKRQKKVAPAKKKKSEKGLKIGLIAAAAIFILLIGTYYIGKSNTSVAALLKDFETAIEEKDVDVLLSMLTVNHKELELTEDSIEAFIQLYDSKPSELSYLINNLKYQADDIGTLAGMFTVDLIKDGKTYLFFDNYKLTVNPVYIKVATNYKDTEIIINEEVLATSDSDNFNEDVGPLIPGEYTVEAVLDTGVFHLKEETKVQAMDPGYSQYVDLYLDGRDVSFNLSSNRYDDLKSIKLFINGKETEYNIAKNDRVGPLLTDGSMNVSFEAELPWGTVRTNDYPIEESYMSFNLGDSEEFKEEIMEIIATFNNQYLEAFTAGDPEVFTTTSSQIIESVMDDIVHNIYMEFEYEGIFHGIDFYTDSFILKQDYDGLWNVTVDTITYFEEGFSEDGGKAEMEKVEDERRYELAYEPKENEWFIYDIGHPGIMEEDKMERYTESDPVVYTSDWATLVKELEEELEDEE